MKPRRARSTTAHLTVLEEALRLAVRETVSRPADLIARGAFYLLVVAVSTTLWRVAAGVNGTVGGYDVVAIVWYMAASEVLLVSVPDRLIERIGDDITSGTVAVEMLRPVHPVDLRLAMELGRSLPLIGICSVLGVGVAWLTGGPPPAPWNLLLAGVSLVLAAAVNLAGMHIVASLCFWLRDARSSWFIYMKFVFLLGGGLMPLELLPGPIADVARLLPFASMAYVPAHLASGSPRADLIGLQMFWLLALVAIARAAWRAGERRFESVGG